MNWLNENYDSSWSECFASLKDELSTVDSSLCQLPTDVVVYPPIEDVFNAFRLTKSSEVRVVILGQDPYHGEGEAMGLAFSINEGVKIPPSLRNIFKERESDLGIAQSSSGDLTTWAKQGVLMFNTILTVSANQAKSHNDFGWQAVTDGVIKWLSNQNEPIIFLLWGKPAQEKLKLINTSKHHTICAPHPSPLSAYRGFWGSCPFSQINTLLSKSGSEPIDWRNE